MVAATVFVVPGVRAAEPGASSVPRAKLLSIARQFVDKVEVGFEKADKYVYSLDPTDARIRESFASIPDESDLLLQISLGKDIRIDYPVRAIKRGKDVMISFLDFVTVANFPIDVKPEEGKADGWFVREGRRFHLDKAAGSVVSGDSRFAIQEGDLEIRDDDIWIRGQALAHWMDFNLVTNLWLQRLEVASGGEWPLEKKVERDSRAAKGSSAALPPPTMPRTDDPDYLVSVPNVDAYQKYTFRRPGRGKVSNSIANVLTASGDVAGHVGRMVVTGNDQKRYTSVRATLSKTSDKPDLLGKLAARQYQIGDIATVPVPLTGPNPSEHGFRVSNKDPYTTFGTTTDIRGEGVPGWDVELYRDQQYLGMVKVGDDGRFVFPEVILFAGDNRFRTVQYGPQGEQREDEQLMSVKPNVYGTSGAYDVSLSQTGTQTYAYNKRRDEDKYTANLSTTYEYQLSPELALRSGLRMRRVAGEDKTFVQGGAFGVFDGNLINADVAMEDDGAHAASVGWRRKIGKHDLFETAKYFSQDYDPEESGNDKPQTILISSSARGPFPYLIGETPSYSFSNNLGMHPQNGYLSQDTSLTLATRVGKLAYSNSINNRVISRKGIGESSTRSGEFIVRGRAFQTHLRGTVAYDLMPEQRATQFTLNGFRPLSPDLTGEAQVEYHPVNRYSVADMTLNWDAGKVLLSPGFTYNSNNDLRAVLRVRSGLSFNPYAQDIVASSYPLSGKAGIAAMVYLDKDADKTFSPGDEIIPGALVEAIHSRRSAETDENGEAFLYDLPSDRITDVVVREGSGFDAFWISAIDGYSVRPRPGHITRLEFPIQNSGEIDGTIYKVPLAGKPRPVRGLIVRLYDGDGKLAVTAQTGPDGFYLLSRIKPGYYMLMLDKDGVEKEKLALPRPQEIVIGNDGTIIYGNDMTLPAADSADNVPYEVADYRDFVENNPHVDFSLLDSRSIVLNFGSYNSNVMTGLVGYKLRKRYGSIIGRAQFVVPPSQSYPDPETGLYTLRMKLPGYDVQDSWSRCHALMARGIYCAIEYLPGGLPKKMASVD